METPLFLFAQLLLEIYNLCCPCSNFMQLNVFNFMPLILALGRQMEADLCEFRIGLQSQFQDS